MGTRHTDGKIFVVLLTLVLLLFHRVEGLIAARAAYFSGVLQSRSAGVVIGVLAGVCYSLLYLLVLSEDYALLFGALAIFFLPAVTMIATRKHDWYRVADSHPRRS
jgi:inner membrane protein involved in colicin E2 resistance